MLRKFVCAIFVAGLGFGIAMGDELKGKIVKVDDKKVTFQVKNKETKKFDEPKTYEFAKEVKVFKLEKKKSKIEVAAGLKAEELTKINETKGAQGRIVTSDGKVTEIILGGKKKKNAE